MQFAVKIAMYVELEGKKKNPPECDWYNEVD